MILVTGATGYLGSHLILGLLKDEPRVRALKRENSIIPEILMPYSDRIEWVTADILEINDLAEAMEGIDTLYHCAGIINSAKINIKEMLRVNIEGTANLVNLALEMNLPNCLFVSSAVTLQSDEVRKETKSRLIDFNSSLSPYVFGKIEAEKEVWRGIMEGLSAIIINPSLILSSLSQNQPNPHLPVLYKEGSEFYTSAHYGVIGVQDLVQAMIAIMKSGMRGMQFSLSSMNTSSLEIIRKINHSLNMDSPGRAYPEKGWKSILSLFQKKESRKTGGISELRRLEEGLSPVYPLRVDGIKLGPFKTLDDLF